SVDLARASTSEDPSPTSGSSKASSEASNEVADIDDEEALEDSQETARGSISGTTPTAEGIEAALGEPGVFVPASYPDHELDSWRDHLAGRRSAEALFPHLRSTASYAFRKTLRSPRYCCQATSRWNGTGWEEIPMCGEKMSSSESFVRHVKSHLGLCREQTLEEAFTGEQKPLKTALDLTVASEGK
ncbi:hypothetical protein PIIN_08149, partial [Serendipita indica DSM 11827]